MGDLALRLVVLDGLARTSGQAAGRNRPHPASGSAPWRSGRAAEVRLGLPGRQPEQVAIVAVGSQLSGVLKVTQEWFSVTVPESL